MKKTFKRVSAIFLAVIMLFSFLVFSTSAYTEDENGVIHFDTNEIKSWLEYTITDGEVTITSCRTHTLYSPHVITIPDTIDGYPVTKIGYRGMNGLEGLVKCTLPASVTVIGEQGFALSYDLKELIAPGVKEIGKEAFAASGIEDVVLPDRLELLDQSAFTDCEELKSFTISEDNQYFSTQDGVLFNKDKTELLRFPVAKDVDSYTVPESVTRIADRAFYDGQPNGVLKTVTLTNVKEIGEYAFSWSSPTSVILNDGLETIGKNAFYKALITDVDVPASVKNIGNGAFSGNTNLKTVTIAEGVTELSRSMFSGSKNIETLYLPSTINYLALYSAPDAPAKVYYNGTREDWINKLQQYEYDSDFYMNEIFFNDGTSHKHNTNWKTTTQPTCISTGVSSYMCYTCGVVYETKELEMTEHTSGSWVVTKFPTTSSEGERARYCTYCSALTETAVLPAHTSCVEMVTYTPSEDTHNTFRVKVYGRATMVQFIEPDGGTRTYDRNSTKVSKINSYNYQGYTVNGLSRELYYEIWTIDTNLSADVNIDVRAKYVQDNGYKWDNAKYSFTVTLLAPDKSVRKIEGVNGGSATSGSMGSVSVKVTVGPKADGLRFVMPDGTKTTYTLDKATVLANGDLEFVGKFWANDLGTNVIKVQTKLAGGKWETALEHTYTATDYPY